MVYTCTCSDVFCLFPPAECYTTAQDVLNAAQERLAPRVRQVLEGVAANTEGLKSEEPTGQKAGSTTTAEVNPALRGVSQKLLEKVQWVNDV